MKICIIWISYWVYVGDLLHSKFWLIIPLHNVDRLSYDATSHYVMPLHHIAQLKVHKNIKLQIVTVLLKMYDFIWNTSILKDSMNIDKLMNCDTNFRFEWNE